MDAHLYRSAGELAAAIRGGEARSVDVVRAHLARIDRCDAALHAVVSRRDDEALAEAEAADAAVARGEPVGPLHGVPITLKDAARVAGVRSTFGGLPHLWRHVPRSDCALVGRLRRAGAIVLGRTNVPLMALDWQCSHPWFPEGHNPWDLARTPGGSSGGAAAALAAGYTPLELGSDLGGSIRYPAHACGVLGLRTTDGLLPVDDLGPEGLQAPFAHQLAFGPMARSYEDLRLMLDVLGAFDDPPPAAPDRLRVAVSVAPWGIEPTRETRAALDRLADRLAADGHEVAAAAPPLDPEATWATWGTLAGYELSTRSPGRALRFAPLRWLFAAYMLHYKIGAGPFTRALSAGLRAGAADYEEALRAMERLREDAEAFFAGWDLWILPVAPSEAIPRQRRGSPVVIEGRTMSYADALGGYTVPTTTLGTPALTVPIGRADSGLPIGAQVHAARYADRRLLAIAERHLARHAPFRPPPDLADRGA